MDAKIPINPSESTKRRNPHLYAAQQGLIHSSKTFIEPAKRMRQSSKPLMNELEAEFHDCLIISGWKNIRIQSLRLRLGNNHWYKPDFASFVCSGEISPCVWEVKGPHAFRGGLENLKVAAGLYPELMFWLVWKQDGQWKEQLVLP